MIFVSKTRYVWTLIVALALPSSSTIPSQGNCFSNFYDYGSRVGNCLYNCVPSWQTVRSYGPYAIGFGITAFLTKYIVSQWKLACVILQMKDLHYMTNRHLSNNKRIKFTPENIGIIKRYDEVIPQQLGISARVYIELLALAHIFHDKNPATLNLQEAERDLHHMNTLLPEPITIASINYFANRMNDPKLTPFDFPELATLKYAGIK